jgi:23S rRNA pseudouridine2605 synthase
MTLRQGVNRQIRRMCRDLGLVILRLRRVGVGAVRLGDVPPGSWRHLSAEEIAALVAPNSSTRK